jgi:pSer/pThr/pTyr-binding forkhead associated (FHA) protein
MRLEIIHEDGRKEIFVTQKTSLTVGRSATADISIKSESLSRKHLTLNVTDGKIFLSDLASANGTFVNEEKLKPNTPLEWQSFFPIRVGPNIFISLLPDEDPMSEPLGLYSMPKRSSPIRESYSVEKSKSDKKRVQQFDETEGHSVRNLLIVIAVLGLYYLFSSNNFSNFFDNENEGTKKLTETQGASTVGQISKEKIQDLLTRQKCKTDEERDFCQLLNYPYQNIDGVIIRHDDLYLFMDFYLYTLDRSFQNTYNLLTSEKRSELLMLMAVFNDPNRGAFMNANFNSIFIINYDNTSKKILNALKISTKSLNKLSPLDIQTVFDGLKRKDGMLYSAVMKPMLEWGE